ncbi:MAG TPA: hypothetical protein VL334_16600 [Anaerolineae bacterium]|nr:hypothetical protein [Anaerolineae bacterium]
MTQAITINLPDQILSQLKRAAELTRQPMERIIAQSLATSLPPLLEDIPPEYHRDVFPILQMSPRQLQAEALRVFPSRKWQQYERLLAKKKEQSLTPEEETRLAELRREADVMTLRKGYAAVLLKRQGYRIPSVDELPLPS